MMHAKLIAVIMPLVIVTAQHGRDAPVRLLRPHDLQRLLVIPRHGAPSARLRMEQHVRQYQDAFSGTRRRCDFRPKPIELLPSEPAVVRYEAPSVSRVFHPDEPIPVGAVGGDVGIFARKELHGLETTRIVLVVPDERDLIRIEHYHAPPLRGREGVIFLVAVSQPRLLRELLSIEIVKLVISNEVHGRTGQSIETIERRFHRRVGLIELRGIVLPVDEIAELRYEAQWRFVLVILVFVGQGQPPIHGVAENVQRSAIMTSDGLGVVGSVGSVGPLYIGDDAEGEFAAGRR
mmetsp:Transcript_36961/g.78052  ORF Transcript_36961/g.78052 Transcript_36961/m.78052 type:complete len:291 (-) Transcript_36961:132-1004(-)